MIRQLLTFLPRMTAPCSPWITMYLVPPRCNPVGARVPGSSKSFMIPAISSGLYCTIQNPHVQSHLISNRNKEERNPNATQILHHIKLKSVQYILQNVLQSPFYKMQIRSIFFNLLECLCGSIFQKTFLITKSIKMRPQQVGNEF